MGGRSSMVGMLGAIRILPDIIGHLLHGELPDKPPESMRLRDLPSIPMSEGGWVLLGERPGHEIALGLVGKFWRPVIEFARVETAEQFCAFDEPGFGKTIYDLQVRELDEHRTLLSGLMRIATTDEHARRWFRRYWASASARVLTSWVERCSTPSGAPPQAPPFSRLSRAWSRCTGVDSRHTLDAGP